MEISHLLYTVVLLPPVLIYFLAKLALHRISRPLRHGHSRLRQAFLPHIYGLGVIFSMLWFAIIAVWAASVSSADPYFYMVYLPCAFALGEVAGIGTLSLHARMFKEQYHKPPSSMADKGGGF